MYNHLPEIFITIAIAIAISIAGHQTHKIKWFNDCLISKISVDDHLT
jgi:hypothetical protein